MLSSPSIYRHNTLERILFNQYSIGLVPFSNVLLLIKLPKFCNSLPFPVSLWSYYCCPNIVFYSSPVSTHLFLYFSWSAIPTCFSERTNLHINKNQSIYTNFDFIITSPAHYTVLETKSPLFISHMHSVAMVRHVLSKLI